MLHYRKQFGIILTKTPEKTHNKDKPKPNHKPDERKENQTQTKATLTN